MPQLQANVNEKLTSCRFNNNNCLKHHELIFWQVWHLSCSIIDLWILPTSQWRIRRISSIGLSVCWKLWKSLSQLEKFENFLSGRVIICKTIELNLNKILTIRYKWCSQLYSLSVSLCIFKIKTYKYSIPYTYFFKKFNTNRMLLYS
jgi:hypothetical protein